MKKIAKTIISALPQNKISSLAGKLTRSPLSKSFIKPYASHYKIDLNGIEKPINQYKNLNEFFTRRLVPASRPIDQEATSIISPVDGTVSQRGNIHDGEMIQAKGISYTVEQLLGDKEKAKNYKNGLFITIYLSPKDYHRIHMPLTGEITGYHYIPGRLHPVNEIGVKHVQGLFTKNERLTTYIHTEHGEVALVKVGAFIVGSVQIAYEENVHSLHRGHEFINPLKENIRYQKGEELGFFEFGSTVILLFEENLAVFEHTLKSGSTVKMGQKIGALL